MENKSEEKGIELNVFGWTKKVEWKKSKLSIKFFFSENLLFIPSFYPTKSIPPNLYSSTDLFFMIWTCIDFLPLADIFLNTFNYIVLYFNLTFQHVIVEHFLCFLHIHLQTYFLAFSVYIVAKSSVVNNIIVGRWWNAYLQMTLCCLQRVKSNFRMNVIVYVWEGS